MERELESLAAQMGELDPAGPDYAIVCDRFVAAAEAMREDGYFWSDDALTDRAIKRRVAREMARAWLSRRPSGRATRP